MRGGGAILCTAVLVLVTLTPLLAEDVESMVEHAPTAQHLTGAARALASDITDFELSQFDERLVGVQGSFDEGEARGRVTP